MIHSGLELNQQIDEQGRVSKVHRTDQISLPFLELIVDKTLIQPLETGEIEVLHKVLIDEGFQELPDEMGMGEESFIASVVVIRQFCTSFFCSSINKYRKKEPVILC